MHVAISLRLISKGGYRNKNARQYAKSQGLSVGYLKVIEPARRPDQPLPSRTPQIALVGSVLSLVGGAILAFVFEFIEALMRAPRGRRTERQGERQGV